MFQLLMIAARNLLQHKRRTFLLGGALSAVMVLLVGLYSLGIGMRENMFDTVTTLMTGHVNIAGFYKVTAGQSAPVVTEYRRLIEIAKKEVPEIDYITQRGRGWAKLVSETGSVQAGIAGVDVASEPGLKRVLKLKAGRFDDLASPKSMIIFAKQAERLGVRVGDKITVSAQTFSGTNNTVDVTIAAIGEDIGLMSSFASFMDAESLRGLYGLNSDTAGAIHLYLRDPSKVKDVQERLRRVLGEQKFALMDPNPNPYWMKFQGVNREDWTGQKLDITNWEEETKFVQYGITAVTFLSGALLAILLVIICVGLMNVMWISIRERTREIGTLRAIGMHRTRVLEMFVIEGFLLGLGGTVTGAVVGVLLSLGLNAAQIPLPMGVQLFLMTDHLVLHPRPDGVMISVFFITICLTLVSLIPSFLAARLKPITAMSHIG